MKTETIHTEANENTMPATMWEDKHETTQPSGNSHLQAAKEKAEHAAAKAKESITSATTQVKEKARSAYTHTADGIRDGYGRARHEVSDSYRRSSESIQDSFQRHPIAFLAGTFAAGLALGLALPSSRRESQALSNAGRRVREAGHDIADRAKSAISDATEAAKAKIHERNLDPESLEESASEVGEAAAHSAKKSFDA